MEFYDIDAHYLNLKNNVTAEGAPDLGTSGNPFGTIYGNNIDAQDYNVTGDITGTGAPNIGTSGSPFGTIYGEATAAQWGDLAEKYTCKGICDRGTVMCVSEDIEADVEACKKDLCTSVIGVVSTEPGYTMNNQIPDGEYVALTGLVPVKIIGPIKKGSFIVATENGCARAGKPHEIAHKIGVANATDENADVRLIGCIIK